MPQYGTTMGRADPQRRLTDPSYHARECGELWTIAKGHVRAKIGDIWPNSGRKAPSTRPVPHGAVRHWALPILKDTERITATTHASAASCGRSLKVMFGPKYVIFGPMQIHFHELWLDCYSIHE